MEIALHDFHDRCRQAHAGQRVGDLRVAVDLAQLEYAAPDLSGILGAKTRR